MNNTDKKLPRVAMYIWQFPPIISGAEQQCKRLSQELIKKGMDVFIVTERLKNTKPFEIVSGIPVYRVGSLIWLRNFPAYIKDFFYFNKRDRRCYTHLLKNKDKFTILNKISEILTYKIPNYYFFITSFLLLHKKRKDFDIIHVHEAHWIASFGVWIARLLNKRVVVKETNSGDAMTFNKQSLKSQKKAMQADLFIAVSNKISTDLVSLGIAQQRIKKIPNGINIYDNKWQFNHIKERSVICISKLNQLPNKGIDILLKSWAILIQKYNKKVKLQIFGRGEPDSFNQSVIYLGIKDYVDFPGFAENVSDCLLNSYLFILPSRLEGLSNALLEAMSLGVPCVVTDISGNQDLIKHRISGLLVPSENPEALAEAVSFMLDNPEKAIEMGYNARKTIEKEYAISSIADKYISLYRELNRKGKEPCAV